MPSACDPWTGRTWIGLEMWLYNTHIPFHRYNYKFICQRIGNKGLLCSVGISVSLSVGHSASAEVMKSWVMKKLDAIEEALKKSLIISQQLSTQIRRRINFHLMQIVNLFVRRLLCKWSRDKKEHINDYDYGFPFGFERVQNRIGGWFRLLTLQNLNLFLHRFENWAFLLSFHLLLLFCAMPKWVRSSISNLQVAKMVHYIPSHLRTMETINILVWTEHEHEART